ncbi:MULTISPECIES: FCD domain-containing protein [unclassified Saccharopolyspora]|uniref:FCD domain-containing protein n=1 Tax=unclassified Saccharopolyspora TaxID=2646250 RepID=UPI001CD44E01|nr:MULTISPECIES: GntR family transcriptional regulator [unclassified Saccharopolyspora]MCA1188147.1 GntR family transcriptional regulator [Saccharopolyspora sp. 6T]MCA1227078.1 GntR family transcriptional regulator [Saccharopolyspora sp. 6M]
MAPTIETQVIDLIRRSGLERGAHVREQWVADSLDISRSPVRKALSYLAELGLVTRQPNRGYFLNRSAAELAHVDLSADDAAEDAYFRIGDDHLSGRFTGEFTTAEVRRRYGLTAREADRVLLRMEREDLIRRRPGRGWAFQHLLTTAEAHDQSYRFRMIVEPAAVLEPGFTVDAEKFALHREQQRALLNGDALLLPRGELFRVNAEFHEMVVGCAANAYLLDSVSRVNRVRRLVEYRHQTDRQRLVRQAREHLELLDLLEAGNRESASRFLRDHLDEVRAVKTRLPGTR